jgi:SAM-dependent methyltransferase
MIANVLKGMAGQLFPGWRRRRRFVHIHDSNYWGGAESRSGRGSSLAATEALRAALPELIRDLGVGSILDAPCGDCHWISRTALDAVSYTGTDIVPALIADNRARLVGPNRRFIVLDLVATVPPRADLVLCRDLLVHLPFAEAIEVLRNIRRSGADWLLTTTFVDRLDNGDLNGADWRVLNLTRPPFNLPPPVRVFCEHNTAEEGRYADKAMGLWRVADLP